MAVLGDGIISLALHKDSDLLGLHEDISSKHLIATFGKRKVIIVNVFDQKIECDWSLKTSQHLTCAAVVDYRNSTYHVVTNEKILKSWNRDGKGIDKSKRVTLPKKAYQLLSWPKHEPVIVYSDGTLAWVDKPEELLGEDAQKVAIHWCGSAIINDQPNVVLLFKMEQTFRIQVYQCNRSPGSVATKQFDLELRDNICPISFDLLVQGSDLQLITLWDNGEVKRTCCSGSAITECISCVKGCDSGSSMVVLDKEHIAVAGVLNDEQKGISVWETRFDLMQAWKPLIGVNLSSSIKMHHCWGQLFVTSGSGLQTFSCTITPSTLKAALGKVTVDKQADQGSGKVAEICEACMILDLIDSHKTPSYEKFKKTFRKFIAWCKTHPSDVILLRAHIARLINRCLSEKNKFWPLSELQDMIQARIIHSSGCGELISMLVKKEELSTLWLCVTKITDLQEPQIVTCLQHFVHTKDDDFSQVLGEDVNVSVESEGESDEDDVTDSLWQPVKRACINQILNLSYNDVFLLESLRKMDFDSILEMLQYVQYLLHCSLVGDTPTDKPSLDVLVDWTCLLLDSHYTQIVLSSSALEIILSLHNTVQSKLKLCSDLQTLDVLLIQLKERAAVPSKQVPGSYCIQTLHIH